MPPVSRAGRVRQTFLRTVRKHGLLRPGEGVLVAWSGGPDSTALLDLLLGIKKSWDLEVVPAHFNHGLRPAARREEDCVRRAAAALEMPLIVGTADVRDRARREGLSLEEAARLCRYEFLAAAADETGAARIATGHTMNDQAETLLLQLIRGAGPRGLAGIHPAVEGRIVRPLLGISSEDVRAYLRERRLRFVRDESNRDPRFLRNRVRRELIPLLARRFNPDIVGRLARTADILREEDAYLERVAAREAKSILRVAGESARLDADVLRRPGPALARRIVRRFLLERRGSLRGLSFEDVEDILSLGEGREKSLGLGLVLRRERGAIVPLPAARPPASFSRSWDGKDDLKVGPAGLTFRARVVEPGRMPAFDDARRACCDAGAVRFPLEVRNRRPGDRYRPLGAPGSKTLKEILRARGIAGAERGTIPVFLSGGKVLWAPGLPVAEEFKVGARTRTVLLIERV